MQPAWRQDFPIDWPQDQYVERRDFVKFLVLTSGAFTAGQFTIAAQATFGESQAHEAKLIASLDQLPAGGSIVFEYPAQHDICVLVRRTETDLLAYSQKCTHLSCAVYYSAEHNRLECPCHEGYFSVETGRVLQGPPPRPLPRVHVVEQGNEIVATGIDLQAEAGDA